MTFDSREDAGRKLGRHLVEQGVIADLVLGLPRGGVVVAAEVARSLKLPLDVIIVRKIGHPMHREYAVGAIAEPDVVLLDAEAVQNSRVSRAELEQVIAEETSRLGLYRTKFHRSAMPDLASKAVLIVDDGLATGATTEAAVRSARKQRARRVIVAVPVASTSAVERLNAVADRVYALVVDPQFDAVGRYYHEFTQTRDEEVMTLLDARP